MTFTAGLTFIQPKDSDTWGPVDPQIGSDVLALPEAAARRLDVVVARVGVGGIHSRWPPVARVRAGGRGVGVVARADVLAVAGRHGVAAPSPVQLVVAAAGDEGVVAVSRDESVAPISRDERVVPCASGQPVVPRSCIHQVVAAAAAEAVVVLAARDRVGSVAGGHVVLAGVPGD